MSGVPRSGAPLSGSRISPAPRFPAPAAAAPTISGIPSGPAPRGSGATANLADVTPLPFKSPAAARQATAPVDARSAQLIREVWQKPQPAGWKTQDLSLREAVQAGRRMGNVAGAVQSYWQAGLAVAQFQLAADQQRWTADFRESATTNAQVAAMIAEAEANVRGAELRLQQLLIQLSDRVGQTDAAKLPWPVDAPFAGSYATNIDTMFGSGQAPAGLRRIDQSLPKLRAWFEAQATAVAANRKWLAELDRALDQGSVGLDPLLAARQKLVTQQNQFFNAIGQYNQQIARYALSVAPADSVDVVVSMLIPTELTVERQASNERVARAQAASRSSGASGGFRDVTPQVADRVPARVPDRLIR